MDLKLTTTTPLALVTRHAKMVLEHWVLGPHYTMFEPVPIWRLKAGAIIFILEYWCGFQKSFA